MQSSTDDLEEDIRRYFAVDQVWLVSSGTSALVVTLAALKRRSRRTDVVLPAYTCFSVPATASHSRTVRS